MGGICCADNDDNTMNNHQEERSQGLPFKVNFRQGTFRDRVYGSILGSLLGSACGAYSDNSEEQLSQAKVNKIMDMPNGGYHGTAPGQIAESGELTLCLLRALVEANGPHIIQSQMNLNSQDAPETILNTDKIAGQYKKWFISEPFEVDETFYKAVSPLLENQKAIVAKNATLAENKESLSSSSLSRLTPLAVWASTLRNDEEFKRAIEAEVSLTHCNSMVMDACFTYCSTLQVILNHQDDKDRVKVALENAYKIANSKLIENKDIDTWIKQSQQMSEDKMTGLLSPQTAHDGKESSVHQSQVNLDYLCKNYDALKKINSIRHGFILSFYFLAQAEQRLDLQGFFEEAISQTIRLGGKTATNAAIVGGIIGGLVGVNQLPVKNLNKLFRYDCTNPALHGPQKRPSFLSVKSHAVQLIDQLLECRPIRSLNIVEEQESDKVEKKNPQENSSENSPLTIEDKPEDPYNQMIVQMMQGNIKVGFKDYLKKQRLKYPKNTKTGGKDSIRNESIIKKS